MQITKKHLIIFLLVDVLVISIAIGVLFKMAGPQQIEQRTAVAGNVTDSTSTATASADASGQGDAPPPAESLSCSDQAKKDAEAKGVGYEKGTILVTFKASVTYGQAKSFLDAKGLKLHTTANPEDFDANHWLSVAVPKGEEFDWICSLRESSEVRYAGPNPTFELAQ